VTTPEQFYEDSVQYLDEACLRFIEGGSATVPAGRLAETLEGIQTAVLLLAAQEEEKAVDQRFRPTEDLRQHYEVVCLPPKVGSYALPLRLRDTRAQAGLISVPFLGRAAEALQAVAGESAATIAELVPDSTIRQKLLREFARFLPRPGATWQLEYQHADCSVTLGHRAQRTAEMWARAPEERATMSVIGYLVRVDFEEHKIVIRSPVTNRTIDCFARPEVVDDLVENRKDPVQVMGLFTLDEQDNPIKLTDVSSVESVDLSPILVDIVPLADNRQLVATGCLQIIPELDPETMQLFVVENHELGLHLEAATREELFEDLLDELAFLWTAYVSASDADLTPSAKALKATLQEQLKEHSNVVS